MCSVLIHKSLIYKFNHIFTRVKKNPFFFKKAQPSGFFGFYRVLLGFGVLLGFLDKQEKIGKIIQKLVIYLRQ